MIITKVRYLRYTKLSEKITLDLASQRKRRECKLQRRSQDPRKALHLGCLRES